MIETSAQEPATRRDAKPDPEVVLSHLDELPTLPPVAVRLLRLTSDPNSRNEDVLQLLKGDQSLTAKLLSLANSAALGAATPIGTLDKAIVRLGLATVRCVVLTAKVFEAFGPGADQSGFDRVEFWKHCFATACAAKRLAALRPALGVKPDDAFVAGLLHDVGKVALDTIFPKAYSRIATMAAEVHGDISDAERSVLGIDHSIAGRRLAEQWGLPTPLRETAWLHHLAPETLPRSVESPALIELVQLADTFVREQRIGDSGNHVFFSRTADLAPRLQIEPGAIEDLAGPLVRDVAEWSALLGFDSDTPEAVYLKALARANAELGRLYQEQLSTNRRLAAGSRYFAAIAELDRKLNARSDLAAVVRAIAESAALACQRNQVGVFALRDHQSIVDVYWHGDRNDSARATPQSAAAALQDWLEEPGDCAGMPVCAAPRPVRALFSPDIERIGDGDPWLWPIVHDQRVVGGVVYLSDQDERRRLADENADLRSYLTSLGLALGRANARAAAQRLSDELAENNRRLQQIQSELLRSRTLASIAEMAAGAGHELNGPLAVISGRAQMLQKQLDEPEIGRTLQLIVDKAHECSRIVKELMDFAKPRPLAPVEQPLGPMLEQLREELLEGELTPARLSIEVPPDLPPIWADSEQMLVALREVLRNAANAVERSEGRIVVHARRAVAPGLIELVVQDNGYGMSQSVLQRAFDPFFSHRHAGRGRGLGLPRAHRIIDAHGGRLWLESRPEQGSEAHVLLPIAPADAGDAPARSEALPDTFPS